MFFSVKLHILTIINSDVNGLSVFQDSFDFTKGTLYFLFRLHICILHTENKQSYIWIVHLQVPDLFFRNEKRAVEHKVTVPNRLLRLSPDGTVLYSQR